MPRGAGLFFTQVWHVRSFWTTSSSIFLYLVLNSSKFTDWQGAAKSSFCLVWAALSDLICLLACSYDAPRHVLEGLKLPELDILNNSGYLPDKFNAWKSCAVPQQNPFGRLGWGAGERVAGWEALWKWRKVQEVKCFHHGGEEPRPDSHSFFSCMKPPQPNNFSMWSRPGRHLVDI